MAIFAVGDTGGFRLAAVTRGVLAFARFYEESGAIPVVDGGAVGLGSGRVCR